MAAASGFASGRGRLRLLAGVLVCALLTSCATLRQSGDDPEPAAGTGTQAWTGQGLVLASCDPSGVSATAIELWEIDPVTGEQTGHRPAIEAPGNVRLAYSCDEPPAVSRRLFNADFTAVAVQIIDSGSGASRVGALDLTNGQVRAHSRPLPSAYAPLPHDDLAVYDPEGRVLWYRARDSGTVMSFDPEAPSEDAWTEHGAVAANTPEVVAGDGDDDAASWYYASARGLANPSGRVVAVGSTLYDIADARRFRMFCTEAFSDEAVTGDECIASDSATDHTPDVTPVAWFDDDTLLALDEQPGAAINTVVTLEFNEDHTSVAATPALPPSDWLHNSVVVSVQCRQFATFAARGDDLALFVQDLYAGDAEMPALVANVDGEGSEAPDAPSRGARLIDWVPPAGGEAACVS